MDDAEFARLYAATSRQVWAFLRRSVDTAEADDLLQEAYFRFLRSGKRTESDEHAKNYLFRIAANLLRDLYRRRKVRAHAPEPEEHAVEPERASLARNELQIAFADLGDRDRQLLWLAHAEGFSHREIAEILEIKEASVRPMLFRARQRAAAHLRGATQPASGAETREQTDEEPTRSRER